MWIVLCWWYGIVGEGWEEGVVGWEEEWIGVGDVGE